MSKENIIVVLDNSEFMRNGDYTPTRFEAQMTSANLIFRSKTSQNRETLIGILTMAGRSPVVQTSLTNDFAKLRASSGQVRIDGFVKFEQSLKIAQLAVKRHGQLGGGKRLIVFVGSPIKCDEKAMEKLGKRLKRNNIAIDIVNFGECAENQTKLEALYNAADKQDNSCLLTIPQGPHVLSDMILTSKILQQGAPEPGGIRGGPAPGVDFPGGVDPSVDPELAEALRLSMLEYEEEQRRRAGGDDAAAAAPSTPAGGPEDDVGDVPMEDDDVDDDGDDELQRAIAMSLGQGGGEGTSDAMATGGDDDDDLYKDDDGDAGGEQGGDDLDSELYGDDDDAEDDVDRALRMSLLDQPPEQVEDDGADQGQADVELQAALSLSMQGEDKQEEIKDILKDEAFLDEVLGSLPGLGEEQDGEDDKKKKKKKPPEQDDK